MKKFSLFLCLLLVCFVLSSDAQIRKTPNAGSTSAELQENGSDELLVETQGTACPASELFQSDGSGGVDCSGDPIDLGSLSLTTTGQLTGSTLNAAATTTPTANFDDSDSASETSDATLACNATDTGAGTEDVDCTLSVQVNSTRGTSSRVPA